MKNCKKSVLEHKMSFIFKSSFYIILEFLSNYFNFLLPYFYLKLLSMKSKIFSFPLYGWELQNTFSLWFKLWLLRYRDFAVATIRPWFSYKNRSTHGCKSSLGSVAHGTRVWLCVDRRALGVITGISSPVSQRILASVTRRKAAICCKLYWSVFSK